MADDLKLIDDRIIHWFAQNVLVSHPKLTPIPIGLENKRLVYAGIPWVFKRFAKKLNVEQKANKILVSFSVATNPEERTVALNSLVAAPITNGVAEKISGWPNQYEYAKLLSKYKFVASPPGNGDDCIRTWEAMYLCVIPIVKRSVSMEHFKDIGLPLWILDNWQELDSQNPNSLSGLYDSMMAKPDNRALYMDYWMDKIRSTI